MRGDNALYLLDLPAAEERHGNCGLREEEATFIGDCRPECELDDDAGEMSTVSEDAATGLLVRFDGKVLTGSVPAA